MESSKRRETIFEDYPWSLQREKYEELLRENLELSRKMREAVFEDYPRSLQRESYGEVVKENRELSRNMREAIFEDYPRSLQLEKYKQFLKKSIELSRKMRETIFEDNPSSLQYEEERYEELLRENREFSREMREAMFEHRQSRVQPRKYEELMDVDFLKSDGFAKSPTRSERVEGKYPEEEIRAEQKTSITEIPGTEQTMDDWNLYRKGYNERISVSNRRLAETTASKESQLEGVLTKGGQHLPSQSK